MPDISGITGAAGESVETIEEFAADGFAVAKLL